MEASVRRFENEGAWRSCAATNPFARSRHPAPVRAPLDLLAVGAHRFLEPVGFARFRNGGLPLFERTRAGFRQEIVLRTAPGDPLAAVASLHVSCAALRRVRSRYFHPGHRAPQGVASLPIGELELPPSWTVWNAVHPDAPELFGRWLEEVALPYLAAFATPASLRRALDGPGLPGLAPRVSLELMLAAFGPASALDFLHGNLLCQEGFGERVLDEARRLIGAPVPRLDADDARSVAVVAVSYDLL